MIDLALFAGRILLVILLYLFLFAAMRSGIGLVRGQRRDSAIWSVDVEKGNKKLRGLHVDILGPVVIGRSPSSDIVIGEPYVSATHARFTLQGPALVLEGGGFRGIFTAGGLDVMQEHGIYGMVASDIVDHLGKAIVEVMR